MCNFHVDLVPMYAKLLSICMNIISPRKICTKICTAWLHSAIITLVGTALPETVVSSSWVLWSFKVNRLHRESALRPQLPTKNSCAVVSGLELCLRMRVLGWQWFCGCQQCRMWFGSVECAWTIVSKECGIFVSFHLEFVTSFRTPILINAHASGNRPNVRVQTAVVYGNTGT